MLLLTRDDIMIYMYFKILVDEHKKLFGDKLGIRAAFRDYEVVNELIYKVYSSDSGLDVLIMNLLRCAGTIYMLQPFMDGNKRTVYALMDRILYEKGYDFNINDAMKDQNIYFPLYYSLSDNYVRASDIEYFKLFVSKRDKNHKKLS